MSDVGPINGASSPALTPLSRSGYTEPRREVGPTRLGDKVELSRAAQFLSKLLAQSDVRGDLVERVKQEIAAGTYETPEKVEIALEDLLSDL